MIKNRSFMIGLGSGLLVSALLLQLMNAGTGANVVPQASEVVKPTKEQLQEQAEALGLKLVEADDKRMTEEEWKRQMMDKSAKPQGSPAKAPEAKQKGRSAQDARKNRQPRIRRHPASLPPMQPQTA